MNYSPAIPSPSTPGNVVTPLGWKAEWSAQYNRYFYINLNTKESTWTLPTPPPVQNIMQPPQRKPVPTQTSLSSSQTSANCIENYPTPPPQVSTGYFPSNAMTQQQQQSQPQYAQVSVASQQYQQPQPQYAQSPVAFQHQQNAQQQYPQAYQQPQNAQSLGLLQQQYSPVPHQQSPASFQQQQRNYTPPSTSIAGASPQYPQQTLQTLSPPPTPNAQTSQQPTNYAPSSYAQSQAHPPPTSSHPHQFPSQHQTPPTYPAQQTNNFAQSPTQQPQNFYPAQPKRSSMMGSSFGSGNMMNKMSSKFTQLQKGVTGPPSAANPNGKPADWKKWGKRAAIGVAGIGALALGVDAAGDMFSGAEGMMSGGGDFTGGADLSGGGDFTGGDFSGGGDAAAVADAQTAVDANAMEHAMAGIGEQNSSMLLDPAGATYVETTAATSSADFAYGLV